MKGEGEGEKVGERGRGGEKGERWEKGREGRKALRVRGTLFRLTLSWLSMTPLGFPDVPDWRVGERGEERITSPHTEMIFMEP